MGKATIFGDDVWSLDVEKAYVQEASQIQRKSFTRPHCIDLRENELLQVMKPLYGLTERGNYWCMTNDNVHIVKPNMQEATGDSALFFKKVLEQLFSISGSYVNDVIQTGTEQEKRKIQHQFGHSFEVHVQDRKRRLWKSMPLPLKQVRLANLST